MKIAFLTPEYPHPSTGSSGGIGTSIKNLAKGLIAQGCSVRVLVYAQKQDGFFDDNGIKIQQIKNVKFKGISWFLTRKKIEKIINQLHFDKKIDLVEAPDWTGITSFIKPKKCPIIIKLNGSDTYFCHLDNRAVKWKNKFHEKRALQNADGFISVSQFTANLTNQLFGLKKQFTIISNCIDTSLFTNYNNFISYPVIPTSGVRGLLYFGSLVRKKGLLELPLIFNEVIKQNPKIQLILIGKDVSDVVSGSDSTWAMMQELFSEQAINNVTYLGSVPYQEIKSQIQQADVCVFPTFAEALPVSWIEAMAMQKPIVASNIGWSTEIIEDGVEGFLVHPKEHKKYADKILELFNNPKLMSEFGLAAQKKVFSNFSTEVVAKKSIDFYQNFI